MAQYDIKYPGWQGATEPIRLRPGFGNDAQLVQQAKEQVETEIERLKSVVKTKLGKMDTPQIPNRDVKPNRSERGGEVTPRGFSYKRMHRSGLEA